MIAPVEDRIDQNCVIHERQRWRLREIHDQFLVADMYKCEPTLLKVLDGPFKMLSAGSLISICLPKRAKIGYELHLSVSLSIPSFGYFFCHYIGHAYAVRYTLLKGGITK
jgi:hypothetical protein